MKKMRCENKTAIKFKNYNAQNPQVKIKKSQINIHLCMFKLSNFAPKHYKKIKSQNSTLTFKACLLRNLEDYTKTYKS